VNVSHTVVLLQRRDRLLRAENRAGAPAAPPRRRDGRRPPGIPPTADAEHDKWGELWNKAGLCVHPGERNRDRPQIGGLSKRFGRLVRDAGLPTIRFHAIRHTCGTLSLQTGVELGGHRPRRAQQGLLTHGVYRHAIPSTLRHASDNWPGCCSRACLFRGHP
jgi:integrase